MPAPFKDPHDPNVRLARHEKAIRKLERRPQVPDTPTAGGGIQFDTDPQTGDWLLVQTTGHDPTPTPSYGIQLIAGGTGSGINLRADDGTGVLIQETGGGSIIISGTNGGMTLEEDGGGILISESTGGIVITEGSGGISLQDNTGGIVIISAHSDVIMSAPTGEAGFGGDVASLTGASRVDVSGGIISSDIQTTISLETESFGIRARKGAFGVSSNLYNITAYTGGAGWEHVWYAADGTGPLMSITWNGSSWDYKIRSPATWSAL